MRMLWAVLAMLLLAGCGDRSKSAAPEPLDQQAARACESFEGVVARLDTLNEDQLRSQLLEMWGDAQLSHTPGIRLSARELLAAILGHLDSRVDSTIKDMRVACAGRASPYPTLESNDTRG